MGHVTFCPPIVNCYVIFYLLDISVKFHDDSFIGCQDICENALHWLMLEVLSKKLRGVIANLKTQLAYFFYGSAGRNFNNRVLSQNTLFYNATTFKICRPPPTILLLRKLG